MDAFDLVVGIIGLWAVVPPIVHFINNRLPSVKLGELYHTLDETESLLLSCIEDGSITKGDEGPRFREHLSQFRSQANDARRQVMCASTYYEDLRNMILGLTRLIDRITHRVRVLRANISTSSTRHHKQQERLRRGKLEDGRTFVKDSEPSNVPPHAEVAEPAPEAASHLSSASLSVLLDASHLSHALSIGPSLLTSHPNRYNEPIENGPLNVLKKSNCVVEETSPLPLDFCTQDTNGTVVNFVPLVQRTHPPPGRKCSAGSAARTWALRRTKITDPVARRDAMTRFLRRNSSGHPPLASTQTRIEIIWVCAESSELTECCPHDSELDGWEDVYDPL